MINDIPSRLLFFDGVCSTSAFETTEWPDDEVTGASGSSGFLTSACSLETSALSSISSFPCTTGTAVAHKAATAVEHVACASVAMTTGEGTEAASARSREGDSTDESVDSVMSVPGGLEVEGMGAKVGWATGGSLREPEGVWADALGFFGEGLNGLRRKGTASRRMLMD